MDIVVLLGLLAAAAIWVKSKHPESEAAKAIDKLILLGGTLINKSETQAVQPVADAVPHQDSQLSESAGEANDVQPLPVVSKVPEDSVLRRHYLGQLDAEKKAITHPYPTDSVLRRHHESTFVRLAAEPVKDIVPPVQQTRLRMPEDAVLRRHFLTQLRSEVVSGLFARPTDSVLARHYESHIQAEIKKRVA